LLDQDGDLHFAARIDLEGPRHFRVVHLKGNVSSRFAHEALTHVSGSYKFSFPAGEGRIIHQNTHPDRRRIDVNELQGRPFLAVGQGFTDVNSSKLARPLIAPALACLPPPAPALLRKNGRDGGTFAALITMDANNRIAHGHAPLTILPSAMRPK
jgi:hypothetical protein